MKKYKPLVVVLPRPTLADTGLRVFLNSFDRHLSSRAELVVPVRVPNDVRDCVEEVGGRIVDCEQPDVSHLRAADAVSRICRDQPERPVMVIQPWHTIFQHDAVMRCVIGDGVTVSAEGGVVSADTAAKESWGAFDGELKMPLRKANGDELQIVSPLVVAGPSRLVAAFEFSRFALDAYAASALGTVNYDRTGITALADWAKHWPWMRVVPASEPWVAHGHWATQLGIVFDRGVAVHARSGDRYAILHEWDRLPDRERAAVRRTYE